MSEGSTSDRDVIDISEESQLSPTEYYTLDNMIDKTGGFGKLQFMILLWMLVANLPTAFYVMGLPTLEQFPQYTWSTSSGVKYFWSRNQIWQQGKPKEDITWEIDWESTRSIKNWVYEMDLLCISKLKIGLFGSLYFLGFAISGIFLKFSDHYGRKKIIQVGCLFSWFIVTYLYAFPDLYIRYAMLFSLGLITFRLLALYILILELSPKKYHIYVSAGYALIDNYLGVILPYFYFRFIGNDYKVVYMFAVIAAPLSFILAMLLPESPLYYYEKRKLEKLRAELKTIAEYNEVQIPDNYEFVFEDGSLVNNDDNRDNRYIWRMLKDQRILLNLLVAIVTFSAISFSTNLVSFHSKYFNANGYDMSFFMIHADILGTMIAVFLRRYMITSKIMMYAFALTAAWTIPLNLIPEVDISTTIAVVSAQLFISMWYYLSILNISETFPPLFVAFAFFICHLWASMSNVFSPIIAEITHPTPIRLLFVISFGCWIIKGADVIHQQLTKKHERR